MLSLALKSGSFSCSHSPVHWFQDLGNKPPGLSGYRFLTALCAEYPHGPALQQTLLVAASLPQTLSSWNHSPGLFAQDPRGHTRTDAKRSGRRGLLPLRGIAPARRLREDVRFEAVHLALAANKVRE